MYIYIYAEKYLKKMNILLFRPSGRAFPAIFHTISALKTNILLVPIN